MEKKIENRGGARRKIDPDKGPAITITTTLYESEINAARKTFGSIPKAVRWALENKNKSGI